MSPCMLSAFVCLPTLFSVVQPSARASSVAVIFGADVFGFCARSMWRSPLAIFYVRGCLFLGGLLSLFHFLAGLFLCSPRSLAHFILLTSANLYTFPLVSCGSLFLCVFSLDTYLLCCSILLLLRSFLLIHPIFNPQVVGYESLYFLYLDLFLADFFRFFLLFFPFQQLCILLCPVTRWFFPYFRVPFAIPMFMLILSALTFSRPAICFNHTRILAELHLLFRMRIMCRVALDFALHWLTSLHATPFSHRKTTLAPSLGIRSHLNTCSTASTAPINSPELMHSFPSSIALANSVGHMLPVSVPNFVTLHPLSVAFADSVASLLVPLLPGCHTLESSNNLSSLCCSIKFATVCASCSNCFVIGANSKYSSFFPFILASRRA